MSEDPARYPRDESLWLATTPPTDYDPIEDGLTVDVAVIGGGITGLSTAINLIEAGRTVAVVEADRIVSGVTGHTTAKLTSLHGLIYDELLSEFGRSEADQYATANEAAIDEVESRAASADIDCEFERTAAYTYSTSTDDLDTIRAEVRAAQSLGLPASFVESTPLPFDVEGAVKFEEQAAFHPRKYLLAVAEQVHGDGSYVFEETQAQDVDPGSPCTVDTERGSITADDVVIATHFPFFDRAGYFSRMHPHMAYLLAVQLSESPPEGMYYSTNTPADTIRHRRTVDGQDMLLVGGQSHKPGEKDISTKERYRRCEAFAREYFPVESVEYRWSTMDYSTVDGVPFIGQIDPFTDSVYVGAGFSGWGMTGGTAAGMIISDLIVDGSSPWAEVFDPQRLTPGASTKEFVTENAEVGVDFLKDWAATVLSPDEVPVDLNEASVTRHDGRPVGIFRDGDGSVHAVSAICPHMGCLVRWNDAERTWDCPCHGSRFDYDGDVISGPALDGLESREL
ncbi:(2Fe-2S)-binding protein [Halobacteriales archaeon SW_7_65_23]|nr:MAG: (2Fe-2S)-binding protein [Halobacteriales archaeon SW_7_65_23]